MATSGRNFFSTPLTYRTGSASIGKAVENLYSTWWGDQRLAAVVCPASHHRHLSHPKERKQFEPAFRHNPKAIKTVVENWDRRTPDYDFPREHWKHLRTSNV